MGSRANTDAARERRVRRIAMRQGLQIMKPLKPEPRVRAKGGYMLREEKSRKVVLGESGYQFSATLDDIEEYFEKIGAEDEE
jgi:hypothetical protein